MRNHLAAWLAPLVLVVGVPDRSALKAQDAPAGARPATLVVRIAADAVLQVDGTPTRQSGEVRRFVSPPLQPGRRFSYTLAASWEPNNYTKITRTRKAPIAAGETTEVDLRAANPKQPDEIVIRFVPTPEPVVEAMLKLGDVRKGDVVYDLGCGDGRIVIAAVRDRGARRGVGFDIDPQRIAESRENARKAGVQDRVEFRREDVLKIKDFSPANVVMLYMADELNRALRPDLQKTLKPGSRVVSHRFLMGDWKLDKTVTVNVEGEDYQVHLWKIR
jgi:uncharacterized protein (TIGR03000 family)